MSDFITHDHSDDGVDRRGFLKCMAWAGTGMLWTIKGASLSPRRSAERGSRRSATWPGAISSSSRSATATSASTRRRIRTSPRRCASRSTGSTLCRDSRRSCCTPATSRSSPPRGVRHGAAAHRLGAHDVGAARSSCPGEHDVLGDNGASYLRHYGKGTEGGWVVQLRSSGSALHRARERARSQAGRVGQPRPRAARVAGARREASVEQHADRRLRARAAVDGVPGVGLGHGRRRARPDLSASASGR